MMLHWQLAAWSDGLGMVHCSASGGTTLARWFLSPFGAFVHPMHLSEVAAATT